MIDRIESRILWNGRKTGINWFHPRACVIDDAGQGCLMTCQTITGSDVFGHVHQSRSVDGGRTWSDPAPIPDMGRIALADGWEEGVCDVEPQYHPQTDSTLCIGHNVFYENDVLARPQKRRFPVYTVRAPDGSWTPRARLEWNHERASGDIYTCGCGQRVLLPDGDLLIPLSFGVPGRDDRAVCSVRCRFDGTHIEVTETGNALTLAVRRGLLEPSMTAFGGRYYLTLRAEDNCGYAAVSANGLTWERMQPWTWEDGAPLTMFTTQHHWLVHAGKLYLVYNRKDETNADVIRWRAPLYIAQVDPARVCLVRESERVVFPLVGDLDDPPSVALMGNFSTLRVSADRSMAFVGENRIHARATGDTLLAEIL